VQRTAGPLGFSDHFRWQRAGAQPKFRGQSVHDERDPEGWPESGGRSSRPVITNNAIQMRMVRPQLRSRRRGSSSAGAEQCRRLEWRGRRASSKQETRHRTALSPRLHPAADGEEQADHHSHGSGQQAFAKQDSAQLSMDRIVAAAEPVGELEGSADHVEHAGVRTSLCRRGGGVRPDLSGDQKASA